MSNRISLSEHGIHVRDVVRNAPPARLYELALEHEPGTAIAANGALVAMSGPKTGRSPLDKRIVERASVLDDVWWGNVNIGLDEKSFDTAYERAVDFLNMRDRVFVVDGYAGWDPTYRIKVRVICARAYHALFMYNMLIRPTAEELADFGQPDYVIFNAGQFPASAHTSGRASKTSVALDLESGKVVLLGTEYAGEMKKGIFTIMHYLMPARGVLSMHCSANEGADGDVAIFFGLSGTGKTTLSADPKRLLIGDDEHCWTDDGVFNIEGGCYAKMIDLSREQEPEIWNAIRFGSVLENVVYDPETREPDYADVSITQNTRGSYPIEFIPNAKVPCVGGHPRNIVFLTCDAFGVLPPVSRLTPAQAMYHFIAGYTAKVAGTEMGIVDPEATFSACFGAPFLVRHPLVYAEMLAEKIRRYGSKVWLVNTGWSGGAYGTGSRMKLRFTRAIIDAIHAGRLDDVATAVDPVFGVAVPTACPGVPDEILVPRNTWADKDAYDATARKLAKLFREHFAPFEARASDEIRGAAPKV